MCHESINNKPGRLADRQALTATLPEHRGMAGRESCRMQMRLQMQDRASRQAHDSRALIPCADYDCARWRVMRFPGAMEVCVLEV